MTVTALNPSPSPEDDEEEEPRFEITCTITNPTTSSIIAALLNTVPNLVLANPLVLRIVNVVPRLVLQSAAPAAKACRFDAPTRGRRTKDRAMGKLIPVIATAIESHRFFFNDLKLVSKPPVAG